MGKARWVWITGFGFMGLEYWVNPIIHHMNWLNPTNPFNVAEAFTMDAHPPPFPPPPWIWWQRIRECQAEVDRLTTEEQYVWSQWCAASFDLENAGNKFLSKDWTAEG